METLSQLKARAAQDAHMIFDDEGPEEEIKESEKTEMSVSTVTTTVKKAKPFLVNTSGAKNSLNVIKYLISTNAGWKETASNKDFDLLFMWMGKDDSDIYDLLLN